MAKDYDIGAAFQAVEEEMINSMIRNLKHHRLLEEDEGLNYTQWQAEQLAALQEYRQRNAKQFGNYFSTINTEIETALKNCYKDGNMQQEIKILEAIKKGYIAPKAGVIGKTSGEFFKVNDRKLQALIDATVKDMQKAEYAALRMANDEYRKTIFNAGVYLDTGAGTLDKAIDMATKDFLSKGLNCVQYANGARVAIDAYASMALRTQATRAYLQGESVKRDEWGINTVIVNKRGVACPMCLKWVGRVYYDDVWGNVPVQDDKYPRLSTAIQGGLYHPNCKDSHTTYFEDINTPPTPMTAAQKQEANRVYNLEQQQRYNERNIRKYKRLEDGQLDPENKAKYKEKREYWEDRNKTFVKANGDVLKRRYENEKTRGITSFTPPPPAPKVPKPKKPIAPKPQVIEPQNNAIVDNVLAQPIKTSEPHYSALLARLDGTVGYLPVKKHTAKLTNDEIITALAGGDRTKGSCASLGIAYIGQKQGYNILDFRDGASRTFFSSSLNLKRFSEASGVKAITAAGKSSMTVAKNLLKMVEDGKEYYFCVGRHAAIVKKHNNVLQYLELQSSYRNGWTDFNERVDYTLQHRFGCTRGSGGYLDFMIDIDDSNFATDEFRSMIGYINTVATEQVKGAGGSVK